MRSRLGSLGFSLARAETSPTNGWKATLDRDGERHQLTPPKLENPLLASSCVQYALLHFSCRSWDTIKS